MLDRRVLPGGSGVCAWAFLTELPSWPVQKPLGALAGSVNPIRLWTAMIYVERPAQCMHGHPTPQPVFVERYLQCAHVVRRLIRIFIVYAIYDMLNA